MVHAGIADRVKALPWTRLMVDVLLLAAMLLASSWFFRR